MDLHTAITLVASDPNYERGTTNGAVHAMRETWSLADVATFKPAELRTAYEVVLTASEAEINEALNPRRRWNTPSPDGTSPEARYERHRRLSRAFKAAYGGKEPVAVDDPRVAYVKDPHATEPGFGVVFVRVGCEWHHRTGMGWCPCVSMGGTGAQWALTAAEHEGVLVDVLTEIAKEDRCRHLDFSWNTVIRMRWRDRATVAAPSSQPTAPVSL